MAIAVANRYARALADVVGPRGNYREILAELQDFAAVLHGSAELREVMETPAVAIAEKKKVLQAILARAGVSEVTRNFLLILADHYRLGLLGEIVLAFQKVANERLGIAQVKVFSAADLTEAEREALRKRFAELTGRRVELEFLKEEKLVGGVIAQVDSTVYDGSVRGHLARMRERLTAR